MDGLYADLECKEAQQKEWMQLKQAEWKNGLKQ